MRILHLIPALSGGGAERQLQYLAPALARLGHELHVGYVQRGPTMPAFLGVTLHRLLARSNYDPLLLRRIRRLIKRLQPDVVQTWALQMDVLGGLASLSTHTPWVFREASVESCYRRDWKRRVRTLMARFATALVSNSEGGDAYWSTVVSGSRRFVVRNGLPLAALDATERFLAQQIGAPVVLHVGRLAADGTGNKNAMQVLEVLHAVARRKEIVGLFCGDGPERTRLEKRCDELRLAKHVHFLGEIPMERVWSIMKKAAALVSLSAYEGCPNTVLEAMACHCPLVISDIPAHREIADENCAWLVDITNTEQVAQAVLDAISDREKAVTRTELARRKAEAMDIASVALSYVDVYERLLQ